MPEVTLPFVKESEPLQCGVPAKILLAVAIMKLGVVLTVTQADLDAVASRCLVEGYDQEKRAAIFTIGDQIGNKDAIQ